MRIFWKWCFMKQVVRLILLNSESKILLVKHGKLNPWALPWWHIEPWETLYETAHREIKEEFNLEIELLWEKNGIDANRKELVEYVKPISIYSVDFFSRKQGSEIQKLEYIFLWKIVWWDLKIQEEEIYEYNFFERDEIIGWWYDIYSQIIDLVKKYT
jgi:ADP-ribose pyrophosphatase YjhB (NUDIX family)